ncbi:hypothetical protein B0H13DRAFT_1914470 [Mycena leptocephala]|nr:hypothetical protein B0H13DRAFT_1914470 [Mycena leptocephala]
MASENPQKQSSAKDLADILFTNNPDLDPNHWLLFTNAVELHSKVALSRLSNVDKGTAEYTLLHASDPKSPAQLLVAHPHRPNHLLKSHLICARSWPYFVKERAWYKVLKDAKAVYNKVLTIAKTPDTKLDDKPAEVALALGRLQLLNDTRKVGSGAVHNITQLVFTLQAMLQGHCIITEEVVYAVGLSNVQRQDPNITLEQVKGIIKNPNPQAIAATVAVALAYLPLYLLLDRLFSNRGYNSRLFTFQLWIARGNAYGVDLDHPLGRLERILWLLILCVLAHKLHPEDDILHHYENALAFASNAMTDAEVLRMDEDEDDNNHPTVATPPPMSSEWGEPPMKRQRTETGGSSSSLALPVSTTPTVTGSKTPKTKTAVEQSTRVLRSPPALRVPESTIPATKPKSQSKPKPKAKVKARSSVQQSTAVGWMAVSSTWELPVKPETVAFADAPCINQTELHDLADEEDILEIPYWVFNPPSPDNPGAELRPEERLFRYWPFKQTQCKEIEQLRKILKSQPKTAGGVAYPDKAEIPQHIHPISQRYHSSSKIRDEHGNPLLSDFVPNSMLSSVYPMSRYAWQELTDFTHVDRPAIVQDLGAQIDGEPIVLKAGRPSDLLYCSRERIAREKAAEKSGVPPAQGQAFNLLSNRTPEKTTATPFGSEDDSNIACSQIASHEVASNWLQGLGQVPNETLWWVGRLKKGVDPLGGLEV